jgi:hypothetical protein
LHPNPRDLADRRPNLVEPDFIADDAAAAAIQKRVPDFASVARTLNDLDFGRLASDLFGLDTGALIGLEYWTRLRVLQSVYLVGSWTPRASGFRPGVSLKTFGIEKRLRGHVLQLNVSNGLGTTMAEMARGATNDRNGFLGFNLSRKFELQSDGLQHRGTGAR